MTLNDKIKQILTDKNISPSLFADEVGIQRSSISHILVGRNKPSLDIVQKIIKRFPDLGLNWILDEEELPANIGLERHSGQISAFPAKKEKAARILPQPESSKKNKIDNGKSQENVSPNRAESKEDKKVEKVMVFYSDGTFQEFRQA